MQTIDSLQYIYYKISWIFVGASWLEFAANCKTFREYAKILFVFHKFRIFRENEWIIIINNAQTKRNFAKNTFANISHFAKIFVRKPYELKLYFVFFGEIFFAKQIEAKFFEKKMFAKPVFLFAANPKAIEF